MPFSVLLLSYVLIWLHINSHWLWMLNTGFVRLHQAELYSILYVISQLYCAKNWSFFRQKNNLNKTEACKSNNSDLQKRGVAFLPLTEAIDTQKRGGAVYGAYLRRTRWVLLPFHSNNRYKCRMRRGTRRIIRVFRPARLMGFASSSHLSTSLNK